MGAGILTGQETKYLRKIDAQSLQSAYQNGLLSNAKDVSTSNPKAIINRPHIVNNTSSNIPSDLSWGVREVYYYGRGQFIIQITGMDTSGNQNRWNCIGNTEGDTTTIGLWNSERYVHPTSSGNKHIPSGGSEGQVLKWSADGTAMWGYSGTKDISNITTTNNGNTITVTYVDGSKEVMTVVDQNDYKVEEYDSSGTLIKTTTSTTDANGDIDITIT